MCSLLMPMKQLKSLLYLLPWVLFLPLQAQDEIRFDPLTSLNGLSHNTVFAITQDNQGFMWFGTGEGLNRFDGKNILTYYSNERDSFGLVSNHIFSLLPYSDWGLFVGTNQGLSFLDQISGDFHRIDAPGGSLNMVRKIYQSSDGIIYVCSSHGLFTLAEPFNTAKQIMSGQNVLDILEYKKDVFWVVTETGILLVNSFGETIKEYRGVTDSEGNQVSLKFNTSCLYSAEDGSIWFGTKKSGLYYYDSTTDLFVPVKIDHQSNPLEVNIVRTIHEDKFGQLWIGTESGLFVYDRRDHSLKHYDHKSEVQGERLSDKAVYSIFQSKEDIMWVGTYFGGVNVMRPWQKGFHSLLANHDGTGLSGKAVSEIIRDRSGKYWIATEDGGVNVWDRMRNKITYLKHEPEQNSLSVNNVHALHQDADGVVWIGTFLGGLNRYDPEKEEFTVYQNVKTGSVGNNMVFSLHRGSDSTLWVGTPKGLCIFDSIQNAYSRYNPAQLGNRFVYDILPGPDNSIWICSFNDHRLVNLNLQTEEVSQYSYLSTLDHLEGTRGFISGYEDSQGRLWFGTRGDGLLQFDQQHKTFSRYGVEEGLPNQYIYGILEDDQGDLWLSTNKGLCEFKPDKGSFTNYNLSHGIPQNQFNYRSAYKDENGWMYFGSVNGLCYFHPDSLEVNAIPPSVYLSAFRLFNKNIEVGNGSVLKESVLSTASIDLKFSDNVFTIEFGMVDHMSLNQGTYAYYLEGFEEDWNYVGQQNTATYTNLSPGKYTFKLKGANNDGIWSENIREVLINVKPPFWLTPWAYFIYGLILLDIFLIYRAYLQRRQKERTAVQLERLEKEKVTELNEHKINFFTYISHEFKTPLTLIIASIDKFLYASAHREASDNSEYRLIKRSAKRLLFLIDQLMEFRRIEMDHAKMELSQGDVILFLRDTFNAFSPLYRSKEINYRFRSSPSNYSTYFDSDKLEKIITNLISNAIKHTAKEGVIEMEVKVFEEGDNRIQIILSDSGNGINPEELSKIFRPFYQTEKGGSIPLGSGIGLALVKSLIDFMDGTIEVQSNLQRGTFITIELPIGKTFDADVIGAIDGNKTIDLEHEIVGKQVEPSTVDTAVPEKENYHILIVEDNSEILRLMVGHFTKQYKVSYAENGAEALEKVTKTLPDVIISDIMMPEMDGLTLCEQLKSNISTSHIPVLLLTAKTSRDNRLEGLDMGADMYITKPFNLQEIDLRVRNILKSRERLKKHFVKFAELLETDMPINNKDEDFMLKLISIVEDNLEHSDFNISAFANAAGVSRSLLHMKLKKLVGLNATEFVKAIRLKHAAQLLEQSSFSISEIAFKVGYADPSYFTKTFKEKYNSSPTAYRRRASNAVNT